METKDHTLLNQFNETIEAWIACLEDYTMAQLFQKPPAGGWSLGQVYVHIIDDTKYYIEQMKAALSGNEHSGEDMHTDAKAIFAQNGFPDILMQGPATDANVSQPLSKEELLEGLIYLKKEVNWLFLTADVAQSTGKTKHPGLLFFNAAEWIQFAEMHMRHHFRQKKRLDDQFK